MTKPIIPPIVERPAFALWVWQRRLELRDVAAAIGCSHEQARLITLPFDDPKRRVPGAELMEKIFKFTDGAILPAHFYPERLRTPAPAEPVLEMPGLPDLRP